MLEQKSKSFFLPLVGSSCFVCYHCQDAKQFTQNVLGNPQSALLIEFLRGLGLNACLSTTSITVGHKRMLEIDIFVPPCLSFD